MHTLYPESWPVFPQKLAFQYLEELTSEFSRLYGPQIDSVARPYAFIKFGAPRLAFSAPPPAGQLEGHTAIVWCDCRQISAV